MGERSERREPATRGSAGTRVGTGVVRVRTSRVGARGSSGAGTYSRAGMAGRGGYIPFRVYIRQVILPAYAGSSTGARGEGLSGARGQIRISDSI